MIITLSPAKLLNFNTSAPTNKHSTPMFEKDAQSLNQILQNLSKDDISEMMNISPELTMQVYDYIHTFELKETPKKQAVFAFNGIAYQGLDAYSLSDDALDFAQDHLISLSGLYGIIRPLDLIKPYRLEMGRNLKNSKGANLYAYWTERVTAELSKRLEADDNTLINLASNEYGKVISKKLLPKDCTIITPQFKEIKGDKYRQVVVYTKKARGMMSRFIIENQLTDVEHLKAFDYEGYTFASHLSNKKDWVFVR